MGGKERNSKKRKKGNWNHEWRFLAPGGKRSRKNRWGTIPSAFFPIWILEAGASFLCGYGGNGLRRGGVGFL